MVKHLTENIGFGAPTAVQAKTIPRMLAGRDVLVRAETGSGKTLSYIAPLFSRIGGILPRVTRNEGTRGLVLVPTRELATQVEDTARLVGRPFHWVVTSSIMGGENRGKEKARLRKGVCLLIATPGRLLDHLRMTESFNVDNLRWLVLDGRSIIRFRIRGRFERHLERDRSSNGGRESVHRPSLRHAHAGHGAFSRTHDGSHHRRRRAGEGRLGNRRRRRRRRE